MHNNDFSVVLSCITDLFFFFFFALRLFYDTQFSDFIFTYWIRVHIHWFNYSGNHSVFNRCCLGKITSVLLAYSYFEVWNWLFFRVNKSDIRVKWAFCFYFIIYLFFVAFKNVHLSRNMHQWDEIQSQLSDYGKWELLLVKFQSKIMGNIAIGTKWIFNQCTETTYFLFFSNGRLPLESFN